MATPSNKDGIIYKLVMVFAVHCSQDKSCCHMYPDTRICKQFKSCTVINYWLRDNLYRYTAPVPATKLVTGDNFLAPIKLVPRHAYLRSNSVHGWQKPRRAPLLTAVYQNPAINKSRAFRSQPSVAMQRLQIIPPAVSKNVRKRIGLAP